MLSNPCPMSFSEACVAHAVRSLNAGGRMLQRSGLHVPDLRPERLLRAAEQRSGLTKLGDWAIEEPLERLMRSYVDEARLTLLGRLTVREMIVSLLENLLHLEAERRTQPALAAEPVEAPVFIVGLPRTGTTLLHALMAEDPASRAPATWEVMFAAGFARDPALIERTKRRTGQRLNWANRFAPEFKRIHPMAPDLPQECIAITAMVFLSIQFHTTHAVGRYQDWFERHDQNLAYAFHRRFLQHLQSRGGPRRWVLKAPGHLFGLPALLHAYPGARVIHTHRDPLRVMASMASHATVLRQAFSDHIEPRHIALDWARRWGAALDRFLAMRDRSDERQFLDVNYRDLEHEPLAAIERVYDFLGWPLTGNARAAMLRFLAANPKDKHGAHRYSLAQYGLDRATERARFAAYCDRFQVTIASE
jgi:hypothetical protein